MREEFGPDDPCDNEFGNAYADYGEITGEYAIELLDELSQPLVPEELDELGWYWPEGDALSTLVSMEVSIPMIRATGDVSVEEMEQFQTTVVAYHLALPITAAERSWLLRVERGADPHSHHLLNGIGVVDEEIVANGLRQRLNGRDMLRRWLAWRRETEEFEGAGTLDLARENLRGMIELLLPNERLPKSYRLLRGIPIDPAELQEEQDIEDFFNRMEDDDLPPTGQNDED